MVMEVVSQRPSSTLNPNAPMFIPLAYRTVEDFSDQWWDLVQSSSWFRDYWLQERFHDAQTDSCFPDIDDLALPNDLCDDCLIDDYFADDKHDEEKVKENRKDLVKIGAMKPRVLGRAPRYVEKPSKIVNMKMSPRTIQQPR